MCPATELWQDKVNQICSRLIRECGVNGIYLDQIGAASPRPCFDPEHGHPLGGGRYWVDGYRAMLDRVKAEAAANGVTLTTENTAEPYMDNIDGYLAWIQRNDNDVPLLPAVYSGYTIYFTSPQSGADDLGAFVMAQGRDFLWGCQLGWNGEWILDERHRNKLEFQLELCRTRLAAKDFMVYGRLLDEIRPVNALPAVSVDWHRRSTHSASLPAVQGTLWRSGDGRLAAFLVNYDSQPHEVEYVIDPSRWLGPSDGGPWLLSRLTGRGTAPWQVAEAGPVRRRDLLASHEILAFTLRPGEAPRKLAKQAEQRLRDPGDPTLQGAARTFLFAAELRDLGLRLEPPTGVRTLVRGEPAELVLGVFNDGRRKRELSIGWPGESPTTLIVPSGEGRTLRHVFWPTPDPPDGDLARAEVKVRLPGDTFHRTCPVWFRLTPSLEVRMGDVAGARGGESMLLPVGVRNNSRVARQGTLALGVPPGWTVEPGTRVVLGRLRPGERRSLLFRCRVPPMNATVKASISASVIEQGAEREITVRESRPRARAARMTKPPSIDGKLEDWPETETILLGAAVPDTVKIPKEYGGETDCSAVVKLAWDEQHLYLAARVRDNRHHQEQTGQTIWQGDCIQLAFRDAAPRQEAGYEGNEYELGLTLAGNRPILFQWMPERRPAESGELSVLRRGSVTTYEAALPWALLGVTRASPGKRVSWSMTVNDNDGDAFRGWLEWTPGICGGKDSSAFGWLLLEP